MLTEILNLVEKHEKWRVKECINLIPSENVMSPHVRSLLSSDLAHRYTAPNHFYMGTKFIDELENYGERIAQRLFKAETADLRPLSGHIADLIFISTFTKRGDTLVCVSAKDGGYPGIWEEGIPKILGIKVDTLPFSKKLMNIQIDEAIDFIRRIKPQIVVFGSSLFLFAHPVKEITKATDSMDITYGFDGSHVLGLIAGGTFQDPLKEGASTLFGSTHKSFFGPQGGIMLSDKKHGEILKKQVYPTFVDNAHWNRIAALTLALAEMEKFGGAYAEQVIRNSQTLAKNLDNHGFPVAGSNLGYTNSHQVLLDYGGYKHGREIAERLRKANIIVDCGVRLGSSETTRRGMKEGELEQIASLINDVVKGNVNLSKIRKEVLKLTSEFQSTEYCFT